MKHIRYIAFVLLLIFLLDGCSFIAPNPPAPTPSQPVQTPSPTPVPTPTPTPKWIGQESGLTRAELIDYFAEVALHTEYSANGVMEAVSLSRWALPIYYELLGEYTDEDKALLQSLADTMNKIEGFPGIHEAQADQVANLTISFLSRQEMDERTPAAYGYCDGFATYYWYNANHEIYSAEICYCNEMDGVTRASVICEELIQVLGLSNDSETYTESIFYQYGSVLSWPAPVDWALLELLYHPDLYLGMTEDQARQTLTYLLNNPTNP